MSYRIIALILFVLIGCGGGSSSDAQAEPKQNGNKAATQEVEWCKFAMTPQKTGQQVSVYPNDDGDLQRGRTLANSRFGDLLDGTARDNDTGLMWTIDAQEIPGVYDWYNAIDQCEKLELAGYTDWRLPNVRELLSIVDYGQDMPALTPDHPFVSAMPSNHYWWVWSSSDQIYRSGDFALVVSLGHGDVGGAGRAVQVQVWCVR